MEKKIKNLEVLNGSKMSKVKGGTGTIVSDPKPPRPGGPRPCSVYVELESL